MFRVHLAEGYPLLSVTLKMILETQPKVIVSVQSAPAFYSEIRLLIVSVLQYFDLYEFVKKDLLLNSKLNPCES